MSTEAREGRAVTNTYRVERRTEGREVYLVEADSPEEAARNWTDGALIVSEALSSQPFSVELEDEL